MINGKRWYHTTTRDMKTWGFSVNNNNIIVDCPEDRSNFLGRKFVDGDLTNLWFSRNAFFLTEINTGDEIIENKPEMQNEGL